MRAVLVFTSGRLREPRGDEGDLLVRRVERFTVAKTDDVRGSEVVVRRKNK